MTETKFQVCKCEIYRKKAKEDKPDYPYEIMEFYIKKLKGEVIYNKLKELDVSINHKEIQIHLWDILETNKIDDKKFKASRFDRYWDSLEGCCYAEYPHFKEDEDFFFLEKCDLPPLRAMNGYRATQQ